MIRRHKKICFVDLYDEENLGDPVIAYCAEWLFRQCMGDEQTRISHVSLSYVEKQDYTDPEMPFLWRIRRDRYIKKGWDKEVIKFNRLYAQVMIRDYFKKTVRRPDMIILSGGGIIKFKYQKFWRSVPALLQYAEQKGIPVAMNAVGVEGYEEGYHKCLRIKEALHLPSLKYFSTRDDYDTAFYQYFEGNPQVPCKRVPDPAVWTAEAYGVSRQTDATTIGVGIARGKLFHSNGIDVGPDQLKTLYRDVILLLTQKGYQVEVFTNGLAYDNDFSMEVIQSLPQLKINYYFPQTAEQLVRRIASYRAILATRLHASIIAFSFGIPAVGMVWNNKLRFWGEFIQRPQNYVPADRLDAAYLVEVFENAVREGYDETYREKVKAEALENMRCICDIVRKL